MQSISSGCNDHHHILKVARLLLEKQEIQYVPEEELELEDDEDDIEDYGDDVSTGEAGPSSASEAEEDSDEDGILPGQRHSTAEHEQLQRTGTCICSLSGCLVLLCLPHHRYLRLKELADVDQPKL